MRGPQGSRPRRHRRGPPLGAPHAHSTCGTAAQHVHAYTRVCVCVCVCACVFVCASERTALVRAPTCALACSCARARAAAATGRRSGGRALRHTWESANASGAQVAAIWRPGVFRRVWAAPGASHACRRISGLQMAANWPPLADRLRWRTPTYVVNPGPLSRRMYSTLEHLGVHLSYNFRGHSCDIIVVVFG
jgi:hypothetical protein